MNLLSNATLSSLAAQSHSLAVSASNIANVRSLGLPLDGGPREQLTHFDSEFILNYELLPGGGFVLSRGESRNDVVMLENFR